MFILFETDIRSIENIQAQPVDKSKEKSLFDAFSWLPLSLQIYADSRFDVVDSTGLPYSLKKTPCRYSSFIWE